MINRGGVFSELRSRMLAAIPDGTKAIHRSEITLGDWLKSGTYSVQGCSKKSVQLELDHVEYSNVILLEVENLFNHCLEHIHEVVCFSEDARKRSDAWASVTAYYLGFFSSSILLRLVGEPISFLNREQLNRFKQLSNSGQTPSQGAYQFRVVRQISINQSELSIEQADKIHEATWKKTLGLLNEIRKRQGVVQLADEAEFYDSLCTSEFFSGGISFDWPSFVRNRVNYRPGFAYKLTREPFKTSRMIGAWKDADHPDVFSLMRSSHRQYRQHPAEFSSSVGMMINVGISLFLLTRALYSELLERRSIDKRWEKERVTYFKQRNINDGAFRTFIPGA